MSDHQSSHTELLAQFAEHLAKERYSSVHVERYLAVAGKFLRYLKKRGILLESAQPLHVLMYVQCELKRFGRNHGHAPISIDGWRCSHTSGINHFLRFVKGTWPPIDLVSCVCEAFTQTLTEYAQWLREVRGLAAETICDLIAEGKRFLSWYAERTRADRLSEMTVADIDDYLQVRAPSLRRVTRKSVSQRLRCFMHFAHATGRTTRNFTSCVLAPTIYADEAIPSVLRPDEISAVLNAAGKDRSPKGLRDYAILMLLSTYGLRAGEVTHLRLGDIDWHADKFLVRHTKTNAQTVLPLLPAVGEALLAYLQARPKTDAREIFIRAWAPYHGFSSGSSLYSVIRDRLDEAGVQPAGKRGPHTFRHARAVSLLRATVSPKVIGDLLGHRSSISTRAYLKLATEDLSAVALEIPGWENRS